MYRLLENIRPARKTADTRQEQPPQKWQTGWEVCRRRGGLNRRPYCWEASDQRRDTKRHSLSGVSCVWGNRPPRQIQITDGYGCTDVRAS